jgi:hypothetical protein
MDDPTKTKISRKNTGMSHQVHSHARQSDTRILQVQKGRPRQSTAKVKGRRKKVGYFVVHAAGTNGAAGHYAPPDIDEPSDEELPRPRKHCFRSMLVITQPSRPAARTKQIRSYKDSYDNELDHEPDSEEEGTRPPYEGDASAEEVEEDDAEIAKLTREDLISEVRCQFTDTRND